MSPCDRDAHGAAFDHLLALRPDILYLANDLFIVLCESALLHHRVKKMGLNNRSNNEATLTGHHPGLTVALSFFLTRHPDSSYEIDLSAAAKANLQDWRVSCIG